MEFRVLGPFAVVDGQTTIAVGGARPRALLALLTVHAPRALSPERLIDELWGPQPPASAHHAVQVYVSTIRKALGRLSDPGATNTLQTRPSGYALDVEADQIDARRFERRLRVGQRELFERPSRARDALEQGLSLWRGSAYGDVDACDAVLHEARRLEELRVIAIECLVDARLACGEDEQLIDVVSQMVDEYPLRERPLRQLMLALYRSGRQAEALGAYRKAFRAFDEVGLQPGADLRNLEQAILVRDDRFLGRSRDRSAADVRLELPKPPTLLVGRDDDVRAAASILQSADARLLTITGAPGIGKTRVALAVAERLRDEFEVVQFVALAAVRDPQLVAATAAAALGVHVDDGRSAIDALVDALNSRRTLVVLDNFEHLQRAAPVIAQVLSRGETARLLVTSRAPLRLSAERVYPLRPLRIADPAVVDDADQLLTAPASALFINRARAANPGLVTDAEAARAVAAICVRLDGLPLAIELAAARARVLPLPELVAQLDHRLALLTGGAIDLPDRQQTLRATLDWSYELLAPNQQTLLVKLAVFIGGFTLDAACAVFDEGRISALDTLTLLIDSGLVAVDERDAAGRFMMLETIREYASERFDDLEDRDTISARHAAYFVAVAEADHDSRRRAASSSVTLRRELGNFRAALEHALADGDAEMAGRLLVSLERIHAYWGHAEVRSWLEKAAAAHGITDATLAGIDLALGRLAVNRGDTDKAELLLTRSLKHFTASSDLAGVAEATRWLAGVARNRGDIARSEALLNESLAAARELGDGVRVTRTLANLAVLAFVEGDWQVILERAQATLEASREADDPIGRGQALSMIGDAQFALGDHVGGIRALEDALALLDDEGSAWAQDACFSLAHAWVVSGDTARGESYLRRSAQGVRSLETWARIPEHFIGLAEVRAAQGRHSDALTLLAAGESARRDRPWQVDALQRELAQTIRAESERVVGVDEADRCAAAGRQLGAEDILEMLGAAASH